MSGEEKEGGEEENNNNNNNTRWVISTQHEQPLVHRSIFMITIIKKEEFFLMIDENFQYKQIYLYNWS